MTANNYSPALALTSYYQTRSTNRPARHWATEKLIHDLAAVGLLQFFEGPGPNPMVLSGSSTDKFWLDVQSGVTSSSGTLKRWTGVSPSSSASTWAAVSPSDYLLHLGSLSPVTAVEDFATRTAAIAATISSGSLYLRTAGYGAVGDGGHAIYKKLGSPGTTSSWQFQSSDGAWWQLIADPSGVNVKQFGAKGDDSTVDTTAFQGAFDYANAYGGVLLIPPGVYVIDSPLTYSGLYGFRLVGCGSTVDEGASGGIRAPFIKYTGSHASVCMSFAAPGTGDHLRGMVIENVYVYRETPQTTSQLGVGIKFVGVYPLSMKDVTVDGFNIGILTDDDAAGTRNGKGTFQDVACINAAKYRAHFRAIADVQFIGCRFYEEPNLPAAYTADVRIEAGSVSYSRSDGLNFFGCAFIGSDDVALRPTNNVIIIDALHITFTNCAFERSNGVGLSIIRNTGPVAGIVDAAISGCWFDAHAGYAVDSQRCRVTIADCRLVAVGSVSTVRFVGDPSGVAKPSCGISIRGGHITYAAVAGIECISISGVRISDVDFRNTSGSSIPCVVTLSSTEDITVTNEVRGTNVGAANLAGSVNSAVIHPLNWSGAQAMSIKDLTAESYFGTFANYADDTAAAAGGVAVGETYRNGSVLMVRVT